MKNMKRTINKLGRTLASFLAGAIILNGCDSKKVQDPQKLLAAEYNCGAIVGREHYVGGYYSQADKALIRESMRPEKYFLPKDAAKEVANTSVFAVDLNYDGRDDRHSKG